MERMTGVGEGMGYDRSGGGYGAYDRGGEGMGRMAGVRQGGF